MTASAPHAGGADTKHVRVGLGTSTGTLYVCTRAIADTLRQLGVEASEEETAGPVENLEHLIEGSLDLGGVPTSQIAAARNVPAGADPGSGPCALFPVFQTQLQLVVRADSGISSWSDIAGRPINVGQRGFSGLTVVGEVLDVLGMGMAGIVAQHGTHATGCERLVAGTVDGVIAPGASPHPAIVEVAGQTAIDIVPLSGDEIARVTEKVPYLFPTTVGPVYDGMSQAVDTVGEWFVMACGPGVPASLATALTDRWWAAVKAGEIHPALAGLPEPGAWQTAMPLHEGAAEYYRSLERTPHA